MIGVSKAPKYVVIYKKNLITEVMSGLPYNIGGGGGCKVVTKYTIGKRALF